MKTKKNKLDDVSFKQVRAVHLLEEFNNYLLDAYHLSKKENPELEWKLFALLFTRPGNRLSKQEIIPNLDYLHYHSEDHVDFYCVGYHQLKESNSKKEIVKVGDGSWGYSNLDFNKMKQYFENETKWKYSGRTDLIIANYAVNAGQSIFINYGKAITINLEKAIECRAISSVEEFFTSISNFAKNKRSKDPTTTFMKNEVINIGKNTLWDFIVQSLPKSISKVPEQLSIFMLSLIHI